MFKRILNSLRRQNNYVVAAAADEQQLTEENIQKLNDVNEVTAAAAVDNTVYTFNTLELELDKSSHSLSQSQDEHEFEKNKKYVPYVCKYTTIMRRKLRPNVLYISNEFPLNICSICNDRFEDGLSTLMPCDHSFHHLCINFWLKKYQICPVCKVELNDDIPTKEYIQEKYSYEYLKQVMTELGIIEAEAEDMSMDELTEKMIQYFVQLSTKKSFSRKSSSDSITISE
jgi:hypothetical protein